ncbi:sensor histidine kinase [Homoserinimonas sp. A447]
MTFNRWWHAAALFLSVVLAGVLLMSELAPWRLALGLGALAAFLLAWAVLTPAAEDGNRPAVALTVIAIITAGVGTAAQPSFATIQCLAFPLVWVLAADVRRALVANVSLALSVGVGFLFSRGTGPTDLVETALTVLVSLLISLALGFWITSIVDHSLERQALVDELRAAQEQLAAVSRDAGATSERERLAREIHDTIAQDLTGMVMLAQRARQETDATARATQLTQLEETAREALTETRALVADGAPASLDAGLVAALERLTARFAQETGIAVSLTTGDDGLDRAMEVVVLRCTQESLSNVRKHSGATTATVTLDGGTLTISDNGHGFDPDAPPTGYGLSGMRDRLALVGGSLAVMSGASGTTLTIGLARVTA